MLRLLTNALWVAVFLFMFWDGTAGHGAASVPPEPRVACCTRRYTRRATRGFDQQPAQRCDQRKHPP